MTTITSYTNTVYVTQATTATQTVDCGEGTMIFNSTPSVSMPYKPTGSASWAGGAPWAPPMSFSASAPVATTDCANASVTYTYTLKPSTSGRPAPYYSTAVSPKPYVPTTKPGMLPPAAPTGGAEAPSATDASPEEPTSSTGFSAPFAAGASSQSVGPTAAIVAMLSLLAAAFI